MNFQLTFPIPRAKVPITLHSKIITIGSCFSDVVGSQLLENKINTLANPFGTVFNPTSIFKLLNQSIENEEIDNSLFIENDGSFFHYDFHSQNNNAQKHALKNDLENIQISVRKKLQTTDFLIITLGTAFAYQHLETKKYVSNCHKMPSNLFRKDLFHVKHICQEFEYFYTKIKALNPNLKIILTVSPVRHTRDGIPENQVSKSILRAACHYLCIDFEGVSYFPAYEIMMDELRDYRFYEADLIHPNSIAEKYIFKRFEEAFFDENLQNFIVKWQKIKAEISHRPFNEKSESHQKFMKNLIQKLEDIASIVDVEKEKENLISRIL